MPPAALLAGGAAISAGSSIMQGISSYQAGNAQAGLYQRQAGLERERAGAEIAANDYKANSLISTGTANTAAAGVDPGSGSAKVVRQTNASMAMLNDLYTRYSGNLASQSDMAEAAFARYSGKQKLIGGIGQAVGGSLLTAGMPKTAGGLGLGFS